MKFGNGQFMFVLKNKLTVGFLITCLQKKKMKFNHVNQCTIFISYSVTNFEPKWQQWIN